VIGLKGRQNASHGEVYFRQNLFHAEIFFTQSRCLRQLRKGAEGAEDGFAIKYREKAE
jgi:hypothetical protein